MTFLPVAALPQAKRVECEDGAAAWLAGMLAVPSVQGHGLPPPQSYGPIRVFFRASYNGDQNASLATLSL